MIKEGQIRELRRWIDAGKSLTSAARMSGMDRKTARKYQNCQDTGPLHAKPRTYRTRPDPFAEVWPTVEVKLRGQPRLRAFTLFEWLQEQHPGEFPDSTRRTFERRVARWRVEHGPPKNVFIEQIHQPGQLAASDFTVCNSLNVTIAGKRFEHTLFHCVLTFSNYESVTLCYSESFEALSAGVQEAIFRFGGVPTMYRTDSLAAAIRNHFEQTAHRALRCVDGSLWLPGSSNQPTLRQ